VLVDSGEGVDGGPFHMGYAGNSMNRGRMATSDGFFVLDVRRCISR
jgi:hypothetical protein